MFEPLTELNISSHSFMTISNPRSAPSSAQYAKTNNENQANFILVCPSLLGGLWDYILSTSRDILYYNV